MLRIDDTIFSLDILEKKFICDLPKCFGNCCRYGDSGAPLLKEEVDILEDIWQVIKPYLNQKGIDVIDKVGKSVTDFENEKVTPLINNEECVYSIVKDNVFMCAIEKAWLDGKSEFRKPLSCHLFPVRVKQFPSCRAVNYQEISICSAARQSGNEKGVYVYEFLKEPLIRAFGKSIYSELCTAAEELRKQGKIN